MSNWRIFKKILTKKKDQLFSSVDRERTDKDLPLGFRLGGLVTIDQSDFIIHRDNLLMENPGAEHVVQAWSSFDIQGTKFYRFYLLGKENEAESMIQIAMDDDKVGEIQLLRNLEEIAPQTEEEWEMWIGKEGIIGDFIFESRENEGTPEEFIIEYINQWGEEEERSTPVNFVETINLDKFSEETAKVESTGCLYARELEEGGKDLEYILATQEETEEEAYVRILAGFKIGEADIKIV